jgi:hypothetical protein
VIADLGKRLGFDDQVSEVPVPPWSKAMIEHRAELMEDWDLCAHMKMPKKIAPLS